MNLVDENDNVPAFTKRIYYIDIPEDHAVDTDLSKPVGKVTAVDSDAGDNAAIKYSIIGGNKASVFNINSETGDIYLLQSLDRETQVNIWFQMHWQMPEQDKITNTNDQVMCICSRESLVWNVII
jgi:hypothetical protein